MDEPTNDAAGQAGDAPIARSLSQPAYSPSPRPVFDRPTLITRASVTRHIWGDDAARQVADWIYASTDRIHAMVFGLAPGGRFLHSPEFRTVFGADEVFTVLSGRMVVADPERGEVHLVEPGTSVAFGPNTWHHAFAHGSEPLRVLELFAPPPSTGSSGPYARTRPYLDTVRYTDDELIGKWPPDHAAGRSGRGSFRVIREDDIAYRLHGDALVGLLVSTPQLTVASLSLSPGGVSDIQVRGGDEVVYGQSGVIHIRAWYQDQTYVFEVEPDDACYLPIGTVHEYRNYGGVTATATIGVAPSFLAENAQ